MFIMDKMCARCLFDFTTEDDSQVYCPDCEEYIAEHPDWQLLDIMGISKDMPQLNHMSDSSANFDESDEALDNAAGYAELEETGAFVDD